MGNPVIHKKKVFRSSSFRMKTALLYLGIDTYRTNPKKRTINRHRQKINTWSVYEHPDAEGILRDAYKAYRQRAKQLSPDKGGSHKEMVELNRIWEFIKRKFKYAGITLD